ncbi:MAG: pyridoxamine kinase [Clostridiales bacterium]|nr:pyridoxamine kinase [Clostridiales bacterium]
MNANFRHYSRIKRVAAIHDLSGFGRCALTVVIPALSVMGVQTVPLPTALLSTHTGGFDQLYFEDLTHSMKKIYTHWASLDITFDAIYSGFLGNEAQINLLFDFISRFKTKDCLTLVDPVFGDNGVLYSSCSESIITGMASLCAYADLITPNLTEACFLTGNKYVDTESIPPEDALAFIKTLLNQLASLGAKRIVITGIPLSGDIPLICTAALDKTEPASDVSPIFITVPRINAGYPGTGELFASVLLGKLLNQADFPEALSAASHFTRDVIEYSLRYPTPQREGVSLEPCLGALTQL